MSRALVTGKSKTKQVRKINDNKHYQMSRALVTGKSKQNKSERTLV